MRERSSNTDASSNGEPAVTPDRLACLGVIEEALAVAGFREVRSLAWGHYLYVDDVSTVPTVRRSGYGEQLMDWRPETGRGNAPARPILFDLRDEGCSVFENVSRADARPG